MNKFIGGCFEGQEMPFKNYEGNVFYAANLGDNSKVPYYRTTFEHDGINYIFWVVERMDEQEAAIRIKKHFVNL